MNNDNQIQICLINPNTTASMTHLIEQSAREVADPRTDVVGVTPTMGPASIESHYDEALSVPGLLTAIADHPDADAFVIACFGDPGLDAAREVATVPVIGIAEAAMKAASMLGRSFSVVTTMSRTIGRARDLMHTYGLERQCAGIHACDLAVLELEEDFDRTCATMLNAAREALAQDRSDALVLGCAGMANLPQVLSKELGVPVIDGVAAATGFAQTLARMGALPRNDGEFARPGRKAYSGLLERFTIR